MTRTAAPGDRLEVAVVGGGPTASSLLERLVANAPELLAGRRLRAHLVDPHQPGTGRVWRPDLNPLLWMNSMAEDVTMFTDDSVRCEGPIRPGPTLEEWARTVGPGALPEWAGPDLAAELRSVTGPTFPTRRVQSAYLEWFHGQVLASLPEGVEVVAHRGRAVDLRDGPDGRQVVQLADGGQLAADVVVLALGHLDSRLDPEAEALAGFADAHGLAYVPRGHTADQDLSVLGAGEDVIVAGFGQAFTDLAVLVTEGRGGRFVPLGDGRFRYEPSGREPVLHVGSRRGVPYRSKLAYRLQAPLAPLPRFLDEGAVRGLLARDHLLDFRRDLLPLVLKEVGWAYYHELFVAHPGRATVPWEEFAARYAALDWGPDVEALVAATVPDAADRFDPQALDRPLDGQRFASGDELQRWVQAHIDADVRRRTDAAHSADLGAFVALLSTFGVLGRIAASGRMTARSRVEDVAVRWFSFFMYYASGPPPARLRQLEALAEAGLLRFIGADTQVVADEGRGRFVARSRSHPDEVIGTGLVDARITPPTVSRTTDELLRRLHERGEVLEEVVRDGEWSANTGKVVVVGPDLRLAAADGVGHPRRHALGVFTNRPAAGTFARPRTNAAPFRQNDLVARSILSTLAALGPARPTTAAVG